MNPRLLFIFLQLLEKEAQVAPELVETVALWLLEITHPCLPIYLATSKLAAGEKEGSREEVVVALLPTMSAVTLLSLVAGCLVSICYR